MQAPDNEDGDGLCLVITPLIALMKDQVLHLREKGIKAFAIHTGITQDEMQMILEHCQFGHAKFLYVSPERLESERFIQKLRFLPIALIAVDEAHCISQWGYDFRPSYLNIARIRPLFPHAPVLALTATATPEVVEDIQDKLSNEKAEPWNIFKASFCRKNLAYISRYTTEKEAQLLHILRSVEGSSIVYVRSRRRTTQISELLCSEGISAAAFHAGLSKAEKDYRQQQWTDGEIRVIVATNAFGMGIDKPDVRTVIHLDLPDSIEAYFQEAGRAGRDGETAYAVLLHDDKDPIKIKKRESDAFPDITFIKRIYEAIGDNFEVALGFGANTVHAFHFDDFCRARHLPLIQTLSAIQLIAQANFWLFEENREIATRVQIRRSKEQLYGEQITPLQEQILQYLMRHYTGLFSTFAYIDDAEICKALNLRLKNLNEELVKLASAGIITYIPRKETPAITYIRDRVTLEELGDKITEQYTRKKQTYQSRLNAILEYAVQTDFCRQQLLVSYFGETEALPCQTCDVCRRKKNQIANIKN